MHFNPYNFNNPNNLSAERKKFPINKKRLTKVKQKIIESEKLKKVVHSKPVTVTGWIIAYKLLPDAMVNMARDSGMPITQLPLSIYNYYKVPILDILRKFRRH